MLVVATAYQETEAQTTLHLENARVVDAVVEIVGLDDVDNGLDDGMRCILDALQQRPQPVLIALAVCVQEHQHVASRVPGACQSRSCQAHAMLRYVLFSSVPDSCHNGNVVQQYRNTDQELIALDRHLLDIYQTIIIKIKRMSGGFSTL